MKRVLLDTNLLLLFLVGNGVEDWKNWKRLNEYYDDCLVWLNREVKGLAHVTLPNILTEASNFLGAKSQEGVADGWLMLANYARTQAEVYEPSFDAMADPTYERLGLTDAAIAVLAAKQVKVLTVDFELANRLSKRGFDVANLWHFMTPKGRK